jgi:hypothetical protein
VVEAVIKGEKTSPRHLLWMLLLQLRPNTAVVIHWVARTKSKLLSLAQPVLTQSSAGNVFSFFAFAGTQCYEQ